MKTIHKIAFDFSMDDQLFAQSLYGGWDGFFTHRVERAADSVLSKYNPSSEHLSIESLTLDLGEIKQDDFYEEFPRLFTEKLDEALSKLEYSFRSGEVRIVKATLLDDAYMLLTLFLLHGRIDTLQLARYGDLNDLFLLVVRQNNERFTAFLRTYGHYSGLQERIVRQFDNESLETGVRMLQSSGGTFICSYVRFLNRRYRQRERPAITPTDFRYAVWSVVYSYLLGNRSSYFNRKSFLIQTLVSLAVRLNITFEYLTDLLSYEMTESPDETATLPELIALLREINRENLRKEIRRAEFNPQMFYRIIGEGWKRRSDAETEPEIIRSLTEILSREDSCRTLILLLKEEEIIRLVPPVIGNGSKFVIAYARELERHKEKGAFEGRAGGEFGKLKWMVIFPVLLENRGTAFNRKSFVRQVLTRISAHYNLLLKEVILFLAGADYIALLDRELAEIFRSLAAELERKETVKKHERSLDTVEEGAAFIGRVRKGAAVTVEEKRLLRDRLSNDLFRKEIVDRLTQSDREILLDILIPQEKEYISIYARTLSASVGRHSEISGKTAGGLDRLVWFFVFGLLTEKTATRFNRRSFARKMLVNLSSHYNLYYADLLTWLYRYTETTPLPEMIAGVIHELYDEERQIWIDHALSVPAEKNKEKLLRKLYPKEAGFVIDFFRLLEWFFQAGIDRLRHEPEFTVMKEWKSLYVRFKNDKWELLFRWIFVNQKKEWATTDFVREISGQISRLYRMDRALFETGVRTAVEQMPGRLSAYVSAAVYRTFQPQSGKKVSENEQNSLTETQNGTNDKGLSETNESVFIENAGLVLISPYLPRLFNILKLTEENCFKSDESRIRAIFLLQYAAYGDRRTEFGEHELLLNKMLVGFPQGKSVPKTCDLTKEEHEVVTDMLNGVLSHWPKLKNTSVNAFQEAFLMRGGKLEEMQDRICLTVEEKTYDLLLDSVPWNFKMTKFPWMTKWMEIKWR